MYHLCGFTPNAGRIEAEFSECSKGVLLLKVDLVPHWPSSIYSGFIPTDAPRYPAEVVDRDNVYLLLNNDNDNRESILSDPGSPGSAGYDYPDDRFESSGTPVLKNEAGKRDDDAIMVRMKVHGAGNISSGTLELRAGSTAGSIDSRVQIYHAAGRDSVGVLLTDEQLSIDLANPDASNPLKPLADGEEVKVFIEGYFALDVLESVDVGLYLTIGGNEKKLSDFTLKLQNTESKNMKFVAHSSVGSAANGWTKDRMQDSSNTVRRDDDAEGDQDRMVPIDFRRRETLPIADGDGIESSTQARDNFNEAKIIDVLDEHGAQCYVVDQIPDAGGWSINGSNGPLGMIVVPHRKDSLSASGVEINETKTTIAHEWLHAFAEKNHENVEDNLMWGTHPFPLGVTNLSQMVNRGDSDEVNEDQKNGFLNEDS